MQLEVENLKCGGCASQIKKTLTALPGVDGVEVEPDQGTVTLTTTDQADQTQIEQTLHQLGYPVAGRVQGFERTRAKAKSYVSCAVGRFSKQE